MKLYYAPMEGITGHLYRNAHKTYFSGADKYFAPFIVANQHVSFKTREINDILPENNEGILLIPQILGNNAKDFIGSAEKIKGYGYEEINLNLGCPAATVVSKGKGSGFLAKPEELDRFLDEIYAKASMKVSIKTRIGKEDPEEFYRLMEIYNQYPIEELIIHPRIQKDVYRNKPNMEMFKMAVEVSKHPICYNGDIFTLRDYLAFTKEYPMIDKVMLGRGLLSNPGLLEEIKENKKLEKSSLRAFHDQLCASYQRELSGDRNVLFKMKENWAYMGQMFTNYEKYMKKIRKAERLTVYEEVVNTLFAEQELIDGAGFLSQHKHRN